MQLSEQYNFAIIEDDYDFDFHYSSSPVLPLASMYHQGRVIYVGSFSKLIAPALRLGFIVGNRELIDNLSHLRRYIDWKGDPILERAVSHLLKNGEIRRYLNKAIIHYRKRRDILCELLKTNLSNQVSFQPPEGGLAVWTQFDSTINLYHLRQKCLKKSLYITTPHIHFSEKRHHHGMRLGFASMNEEELVKGFDIFKKVIKDIENE